ncbi:glycosyltransferase [Terricaulis sp.]|uniref:glycosyltransferase n=1 Tax=Terricaulis sp. TaxID=2768686 RepID=UPI00378445B8
MRVLHVIAGAKGGGAEQMMLDAVTALAEAGVAQHVVTRGHNRARLDALAQARVPFTIAEFDKRAREPTRQAIRAAADSFRPDVVHYWMGRAAFFAPKQHREINLGWYGGYYDADRFKNCGWHIGATRDIAEHIVHEHIPADHTGVLHGYFHMPPANAARRASIDTPEDAQVILAIARLDWESGVDVLLKAIAEVKGVYAWIAGEGPMEREFRHLAQKLGLCDRVRFLGHREDRSGLLAACDVVAAPARHDPFGASTLAAWAARRPLVTTDAAGPSSFATDDMDALVTPSDDSEALAKALKRVLQDADLAAALADNGARLYRAQFTKPSFVRASMALYDRVRLSSGHHERRAPAA